MKEKDLKNLAKKIAKAELIIQNSNDESVIENAQKLILKLTSQITSIEDMLLLDEKIQKILKKSWLLENFLIQYLYKLKA